jgi:outer membrane protein TolC
MPVCSPDDPFVSQETLPLDRLIDEVLARNPSLAALTAMWQAAVQRYPQVISLDDPVLTTMLGPGAIGNDEVDGAYMVGFSQKLPWPGKKRLQGSAARWEAAASGFEVGDLQLQLVEGTKQAYVDYYVAAREMELNVENVNIMREFREAADARYRTNQVTQQDVLQADVELAQLERQRFELERMQLVAVARINTLLHRAADYPLPPPPSRLEAELELPPAAALQAVALERRPDLAAVDARIRAEQASLALMHREFYPDLEIMARYDAFWQEDPLRPMVGLNVDLPIRRDRRWAAVREAGFRLSQRQAEFAQQLDTINNEVYSGYARLEESRRALLLYQERLLPTAQRNVESARAGYVAGSLDFLRLVDAQRQLITLQEQRYETEAEFHRRAAELERVIGGPIPFVPVVIEEIPAPPPG